MKKQNALDKLFNSKIFWVFFSIITSIVLWMYVITNENVTDTKTLVVPVEFRGETDLRERKGLVITDISSTSVTVKITGNKREVHKLTEENVFATIDVSNIVRPQDMTRVWTLTNTANVNMDNMDYNQSSIGFVVDNYRSKMVEVIPEFSGSLVEPYMVKSLDAEPGTVKISGAEREIANVDYAYVEITRPDVDKSIDDYFSYDLIDLDGSVMDISGSSTIEKESEEVRVILAIQMVKKLELKVTVIDGGGATLSHLRTPKFDPEYITIAGDPEVLEALNEINVGDIDLASFATTEERTYPISLPNGTEPISGEEKVVVKFEITGLETKDFNVTNFDIINAPEGFVPEAITKNLTITVRAPADIINMINANNIRVVVDLSEADPVAGRTSYTPKISVDGYPDAGIVFDHYRIVVSLTNADDS